MVADIRTLLNTTLNVIKFLFKISTCPYKLHVVPADHGKTFPGGVEEDANTNNSPWKTFSVFNCPVKRKRTLIITSINDPVEE